MTKRRPKAPNTALLLVAFAASNPDAISAVNAGYGSPFAKGSWKAEYYARAGVTPNTPPEGRWAVTHLAARAAQLILESWGYPTAALHREDAVAVVEGLRALKGPEAKS